MIGEFFGILDALCSRLTWSPRYEADNNHELPVGVREAKQNLKAIASTSGARAAPNHLNGLLSCAFGARRVKGRCRCHARHFGLPGSPCHSDAHIGLLGCASWTDMCMLWVETVRDPCLGSVWTGQPHYTCSRACMRA